MSTSKPISFRKELIGNFGFPVWDNPTEAMVQAAFDHHGMAYRYVTTEVKPHALKDAFAGVKAMGYRGFNCTIPHKVSIMTYLDDLAPSAQIIQAVNCVVKENGKYIGHNTDGQGFLKSLTSVADPVGKSVVILGAGGAALAVTVELALAGVKEITIVNRSSSRAGELIDVLQPKLPMLTLSFVQWNGSFVIPANTDIVINCTSVGLSPEMAMVPVDRDSLFPHMLVCDLIVNPPKTPFLQMAEQRGCRVLDGVGMLVNQGWIGIKLWSGIDVDAQIMHAKIREIYNA